MMGFIEVHILHLLKQKWNRNIEQKESGWKMLDQTIYTTHN